MNSARSGQTWREQLAPSFSFQLQGEKSAADRLAEEMAVRWQKGERPLAEEFFDRLGNDCHQPDGPLRIIYEELCLRQEAGQEVNAEELLARFPHWRLQLEVLLNFHRLLAPGPESLKFPAAGESLAGFQLLAELGRGARGRVFLASQPSLADRPVVLKMTPIEGQEHLSLARLQHTHIVPLYWLHDDPERRLRIMCMPYFAGATFTQFLDAVEKTPPMDRTGKHILQVLDRCQPEVTPAASTRGPTREFLARATYVQAICSIGACLADALHYAHERNLIHLDVKPSNVLLAADGEPMLLDFHLAQAPIRAETMLDWLGGTVDYMSPEQQAALNAVREGRPVLRDVDVRSDIYSLGLVLFEALAGKLPVNPQLAARELRCCNRDVSVGLADLIARCLMSSPCFRYQSAAALALDLRRHLVDKPLLGVANRSPVERWRKWRRREPHGIRLAVLVLAVLGLLAGVGIAALSHFQQQRREVQQTLVDGQEQMKKQDYSEAARLFTRGLDRTQDLPASRDLANYLQDQLRAARRAQAAQDLHALTERIRFLVDPDSLALSQIRSLADDCRTLWNAREKITAFLGTSLPADLEQRTRTDLLDLAIFWADLRVRLASNQEASAARQEALQILAEAEKLVGTGPVLDHERQYYSGERRASVNPVARTAWEHTAIGRSLLRSGEVPEAARAFARAVDLQPQSFWANFYQGSCAYRLGRHSESASSFRVCISLAPDKAECYYNRGLAYMALDDLGAARRDYDKALLLQPTLASAALNRGTLHLKAKRYAEAIADLQQALKNGANPALVHYNLALVYFEENKKDAARASVLRALELRPEYTEAKELAARLAHP